MDIMEDGTSSATLQLWAATHDAGGTQQFSLMKSADAWMSSYSTPKFVKISDRTLGYSHKGFQLGILLYIGIYTCLYQCMHLVKLPVSGVTRLTVQQPTKGCNPMKSDCDSDFRARNDLPYCMHNAHAQSNSTSVASDPRRTHQLNCIYWDGIDLTDDIPVPGTLFVRSRLTTFVQKRDCDPDNAKDFGCHGAIYRSPATSESSESYFIADVERFTLLFGHGYEATNIDTGAVIRGENTDVRGFIQSHEGVKEIPSSPSNDYVFPSMFRLKNLGDVISVADLLKAADPDGKVHMETIRDPEHNMTLRWQGGILNVRMHYTNKELWAFRGHGEIKYTMSAHLLPISEFKKMYGRKSADLMERTVVDVHGLLVIVEVKGDFFVFEWVYLLQMLTTSLAMMVAARTVVDFLMAHALSKSAHYRLLKHQPASGVSEAHSEKDGYSSLTATYHQCSDIMERCVQEKVPPKDEELLMVLFDLEHRLNHLDAHDAHLVVADDGEHPSKRRILQLARSRASKVQPSSSSPR